MKEGNLQRPGSPSFPWHHLRQNRALARKERVGGELQKAIHCVDRYYWPLFSVHPPHFHLWEWFSFSLTSSFYTMPKLKHNFFFLHPSRQLLGISPKLLCSSPKLQWKCSWASFRVHFQVPLLIPQGGVPPAVLPPCLYLYKVDLVFTILPCGEHLEGRGKLPASLQHFPPGQTLESVLSCRSFPAIK